MLTLAEAKTHVRVDHDEDDAYIEALVAVASEYITRVITPPGAEEPPAVTLTQKHCARLLVGHWYEHREAATPDAVSEVPFAVKMLLLLDRPVEGLM